MMPPVYLGRKEGEARRGEGRKVESLLPSSSIIGGEERSKIPKRKESETFLTFKRGENLLTTRTHTRIRGIVRGNT
jgi:hypothetical protein